MVRKSLYTLAGVFLLAAVGCNENRVASTLPPPHFSGPTITPAPIAPKPQPPLAIAPVAPRGVPREWIPSSAVRVRDWKYIVIHHSATPSGGAAKFDRDHRERGFDELGYDFVIGNGTETRNGQIEVGPRWVKQKWGAHAKTPDNRYNEFGIGICLVGNFDVQRPTAEQVRSLARLTAYLMRTYHIPANRVLGHGDTKPTDCPGRHLDVAVIRRMAMQMLADGGSAIEQNTAEARGELMQNLPR
jgi:hypothetical protein